MIENRVKIAILGDGGSELETATTTSSKSNISSAIGNVVGQKHTEENPFIFGVNVLGDGSFFMDSVGYFIGGVASDENGNFSPSYSISIVGTSVDHFTIEFDKLRNAFPTKINVDGTDYQNDDTIFTVGNLDKTLPIHTIIIDNWSENGVPLRIQSIFTGLEIILDKRHLVDISTRTQNMPSHEQPFYGITQRGGSLSFNDLDGEIADYADGGLLKDGSEVTISLINTLLDEQSGTKEMGKYTTSNWNYDNLNRLCTVSLEDKLLSLQNIQVNEYYFQSDVNAKEILDFLETYNPAWLTVNSSAVDFELRSTVVRNAFLESGSLWSQYTKICELVGLQMWAENDGNAILGVAD